MYIKIEKKKFSLLQKSDLNEKKWKTINKKNLKNLKQYVKLDKTS